MAFSISGFGAAQTAAAPQVFQALSLAGRPPIPPAPPYGTPNPNLVPVSLTQNPAVPANLTLSAFPAFQAVLRVTGQSVLALQHPPLAPVPNTTTAIAATNPTITQQDQGQAPPGLQVNPDLPQGPISFQLTAPPASEITGALQTLGTLPIKLPPLTGHGTPPAGAPAAPTARSDSAPAARTPAPAAASTVARIVQTVKSLAVAAVYPAPVFSFKA